MPILHAELQIAGRQVAWDVVSFSFSQATDDKGRPSSVVRVGLLQVLISGEAAGWHLWEEIKFNPYRRESGHVVFFQNEGITTRRYTFYDAALVHLQFRYDGRGVTNRQSATQVELHFSAATIELNGIRLEAHSLIPWQMDAPTSFRALTKPADPKPSAHLAAGLVLLASKAAQVAPEIMEKAAPIALEGVAPTVTLLPGLLLDPVNGNTDPAKDYDWQLYHRNHQQPAVPLPPQPDAVRLAELEHALATQTLTAQQEAELIVLLAKVRGIHVQKLSDLVVEAPLRGGFVQLPGFYKAELYYTKRDKADLAALRAKFAPVREQFLKELAADPATRTHLIHNGEVVGCQWTRS